MKTPMQELIDRLNNVKPTDFCSIETIKGWADAMLEKEKYTMGLLLNFIFKRYSIDFDTSLRGYCFIDANGEEVTISEILEHFYN